MGCALHPVVHERAATKASSRYGNICSDVGTDVGKLDRIVWLNLMGINGCMDSNHLLLPKVGRWAYGGNIDLGWITSPKGKGSSTLCRDSSIRQRSSLTFSLDWFEEMHWEGCSRGEYGFTICSEVIARIVAYQLSSQTKSESMNCGTAQMIAHWRSKPGLAIPVAEEGGYLW